MAPWRRESGRRADLRGLQESITVDHGPESEGQVLDAWAYKRRVQLCSSDRASRSRPRTLNRSMAGSGTNV